MKAGFLKFLLFKMSFPILCIIFVFSYYNSSKHMKPIANNYPKGIIFVLVILFLIFIYREGKAWLQNNEFSEEKKINIKQWWTEWHKTVFSVIILLGYIFLIPKLGFYLATTLFLITLFVVLGFRRPIKLILLTLVLIMSSYMIFKMLFKLPLPTGLFF